ncbi:MAG TPA: heme-binding protein [Chloroflexota bacterium]|nr:heme-binding protein [Chloroflexota bacterium]
MTAAVTARLTLAEARALIDRAVAKAREFGVAGTFVVVDAGGNVVSISRMEGAPAAGVAISRAKAYLAAVSQAPTARWAKMWNSRPIMYLAYQRNLPQPLFPGPGGMVIRKEGQVVGGISTGPGIGGIEVTVPEIEGPVNLEDYIIAYALGIPYENQHGPLG